MTDAEMRLFLSCDVSLFHCLYLLSLSLTLAISLSISLVLSLSRSRSTRFNFQLFSLFPISLSSCVIQFLVFAPLFHSSLISPLLQINRSLILLLLSNLPVLLWTLDFLVYHSCLFHFSSIIKFSLLLSLFLDFSSTLSLSILSFLIISINLSPSNSHHYFHYLFFVLSTYLGHSSVSLPLSITRYIVGKFIYSRVLARSLPSECEYVSLFLNLPSLIPLSISGVSSLPSTLLHFPLLSIHHSSSSNPM